MTKIIGPKDYYSKRTPARMRKLGDALLAFTQTFGGGLTVAQIMGDGPVNKTMLWVALATMFLGAVGKFLITYYSPEEK